MQQMTSAESRDQGLLYSRYEDGARPVQPVVGGWQVGDKLHTTATALLADLTGHPEGRHWSLDRYFGSGRYEKKLLIGQANVFELFPVTPPTIVIAPPIQLAPSIVTLRSSMDISVPRRRRRAVKRRGNVVVSGVVVSGVVVAGAVGIDLVNRSHEVRKLLFAGFGRRIYAAGYDGEDVLQEVYRGLLARNRGRCPWDPNKSSFGHYVYMVCGCVLSNYHRKQNRIRQFEQLGLAGYQDDGEYGYGDAGSTANVPAKQTLDEAEYLLTEAADDLVDYMLDHPRGDSHEAQLAVDVLPYVADGTPRVVIAKTLGKSMAAISRAISFLRTQALAWRHSLMSPTFIPR